MASSSFLLPIREPDREYGRGVCDAPPAVGGRMPDVEALKLFLLGVTPGLPPGPTLDAKLGATPRVLWLKALPGVG